MKKAKLTRDNFKRGTKRINMTIHVDTFRDLEIISAYRGAPLGTICSEMVRVESRKMRVALQKAGYVPPWERGGDLFESLTKERKRRKK